MAKTDLHILDYGQFVDDSLDMLSIVMQVLRQGQWQASVCGVVSGMGRVLSQTQIGAPAACD